MPGGLQQGQKLDKIWRNAIRKAVNDKLVDDEDEHGHKSKALYLLARKLVRVGLKGDVSALKEIGDRLDGKPAQAVELGIRVQITRIERTIIDPRVIEGGCEDVTAKLISHGESTG